MEFDKVLVHPLWAKITYPNEDRILYTFEIKIGVLALFSINAESVAFTVIPKGETDLKPAIKSHQEAWEHWFRPWCFTGTLLRMVHKYAEYRKTYHFFYDLETRKVRYDIYFFGNHTWMIEFEVDALGNPSELVFTEIYMPSCDDNYMDPVRVIKGSAQTIGRLAIARVALEMEEKTTED